MFHVSFFFFFFFFNDTATTEIYTLSLHDALPISGLVFSYAQGIIHPYYTVVLAPAIGALVAIGATWAWQRRDLPVSRLALASATAATSLWTYRLLEQTPPWLPWLRYVVVVLGLGAAATLAALPMLQ